MVTNSCLRLHSLAKSLNNQQERTGAQVRQAALTGAAFIGVFALILLNSKIRWRTYPSSVMCEEATAFRVEITIWSMTWRLRKCGSNSLQNSQGRLDFVSKRRMMAGSTCSTGGSWHSILAKSKRPTHVLTRVLATFEQVFYYTAIDGDNSLATISTDLLHSRINRILTIAK
jgi:hypothetical protein